MIYIYKEPKPPSKLISNIKSEQPTPGLGVQLIYSLEDLDQGGLKIHQLMI